MSYDVKVLLTSGVSKSADMAIGTRLEVFVSTAAAGQTISIATVLSDDGGSTSYTGPTLIVDGDLGAGVYSFECCPQVPGVTKWNRITPTATSSGGVWSYFMVLA